MDYFWTVLGVVCTIGQPYLLCVDWSNTVVQREHNSGFIWKNWRGTKTSKNRSRNHPKIGVPPKLSKNCPNTNSSYEISLFLWNRLPTHDSQNCSFLGLGEDIAAGPSAVAGQPASASPPAPDGQPAPAGAAAQEDEDGEYENCSTFKTCVKRWILTRTFNFTKIQNFFLATMMLTQNSKAVLSRK